MVKDKDTVNISVQHSSRRLPVLESPYVAMLHVLFLHQAILLLIMLV